MPIAANLDVEHGILRVTLTGAWPTRHELDTFRRRIRNSGSVGDQTLVLGDLRAFSSQAAPTWQELWETMQVPELSAGPQRYALVIRAELKHLGEIIETLALGSLEFRAFTEEADAIEWLTRAPIVTPPR
jgi:hypothetical protein